MLMQAYQCVSDRKFFRLKGSVTDKVYLRRLLALVLQTKIGCRLLSDIYRLAKRHKRETVSIKLTKPEENLYGSASEDLNIEITRINQKKMTKRQQEYTSLMQAVTLIHELTHIRQFLTGNVTQARKFSLPHQAYAHVLDEAEATLSERSFSIEMGHLYPSLIKNMAIQKYRFQSPEELVRSFFIKNNKKSFVWVGLDVFTRFSVKNDKIILTDRDEKECFKNWVNEQFRSMNLKLRYQQLPLERVFWVSKFRGNGLYVEGLDTMMQFDRQGRLMLFGDELNHRKRLPKISVFWYRKHDESINTFTENIKECYPDAKIYLIKGPKEKGFSTRGFRFNELALQRGRSGE